MLKHWRVLILIVMILGSTLAIGLKVYPYGRNGVEIAYVSDNSPAWQILDQGMIITSVNGEAVKNVDEWEAATAGLLGPVELKANGDVYSFVVNETLAIDVVDIERTNLEFGLDLRGGTRIIMAPSENATREMVDQIIATLQTRANIYGLKEMVFTPLGVGDSWHVQIEAAGVGSNVVKELLEKQGSFDAKVVKPVPVSGSQATLRLGTDTWDIEVKNVSIVLDGNEYFPNSTFVLKGMGVEYVNKSQGDLVFLFTVYDGTDIEMVYTDPQHSRVMPSGDGYQFMFSVMISQEGAQRFAEVTADIPSHIDFNSGEEYLDSMIYLFLDGQPVSDLRIAKSLGGQIVNTPSIQGGRSEREDAVEEKLKLQTVLRSGALPTTLVTQSVYIIPPSLGSDFFASAGMAILLAMIVVVVIVFVRYRNIKVAFPMLLIGLSEVLIILGIASTQDAAIWGTVMAINLAIVGAAWWKKHDVDTLGWVAAAFVPLLGLMAWTVDLPAIGGIIAAIGTGVDHQIIIADETLKGSGDKKMYGFKDKIKRAFFIIFGAAATTVCAMLPLVFLGVGLVRGFAITTMVGVLVGILITRPAYAKIIESLVKK